jgi:hypothetical protein
MIIYNVTIKVNASISDEWLDWLKNVHIADVMASGCFNDARIMKLLEIDDSEGPTYAIQYFSESKSLYNHYIEKYATDMRNKSFEKWGNKFIAFRSVMQVVN